MDYKYIKSGIKQLLSFCLDISKYKFTKIVQLQDSIEGLVNENADNRKDKSK